MAVAFVAALTPHGFNRNASQTFSPAFTPTNAGDYLSVMGLGAGGTSLAVTGTGTFTQIASTYMGDGMGDQIAFSENTSASAGSQTVGIILGSFGFASVLEYSGVANSSNGAYTQVNGATPTTGSIAGAAVTVPSGSVLLCFVFNNGGSGGGTLTPVGGTNRDTGTNFAPWILADFAGTGASITPTFTPTATGGNYGVLQIVLHPAAGTATGSAAITLGPFIASGTGTTAITATGSAAITLGPFVVSATGTVISPDLWAAIQAVIEAGLVPVVVYEVSPTVPAGNLISQFPAGGTVVTQGTQQAKVFLVVSKGPGFTGSTVVPNLAGLTVQAAYSSLLAAGLSTGYLNWVTSSQPEATVIGQSTAPGTTVTPGTMITLSVSQGPPRPPLTAVVPTVL